MELSGTKGWIFLDNNWPLQVQLLLTYAVYQNCVSWTKEVCFGLKKCVLD